MTESQKTQTQRNWSVPETEVVQRVHQRLEADGSDVLATIVDVDGNAYRRPGAKMLLDDAGDGVGSITAGCLEDDILRAAESVRGTGQPELVTYDLMDDDDDVWGLGVGCNGIIEVLLEPLTPSYRSATDAFTEGRDVAVLTVLSVHGEDVDASDTDSPLAYGDRAYYHPGEDRLSTPSDDDGASGDGGETTEADWPIDVLSEPASELAGRGRANVIDLEVDGTRLEVFVDGIAAPAELVVFGSGHDVGPVTELASKNDFRVTVVGFRGAVDLAERFPDADRTVTTSPGTIEDDLEMGLDDRTYAVVMTHNFVDDRLAVETLLDAGVPYVGLMGPHERFEEMIEEFDAEERTITDDDRSSLYTPIGLDLGGGSPYQIAHSIVAEVLAVHNDRDPRHLRAREGHIHDRIEVEADPTPPK
ncbi:XdhC/CoxI family protein [Natrarchaeobius halalkaliphilus]|uniref:XdhC/CoxI family protein n=1 Tax=Natrarchaeobius halalkaliphilus TaxID=1679091 RepID=A0A3N6M516_9EURY|nr:XdhC/CoxI family protein [Natrarchaeobius halalkaliphilus]RQG91100.1 XdhC/CoxI family protein [Natrarchaeobius halalkaliphilus]